MKNHKEPLPNIGRKKWPPGEYTRSSDDEESQEYFPKRNWDGRVKRIDLLGNYFPSSVDWPESFKENDGLHNHGAKSVATPKPKASGRGRPVQYGGDT